MTSLFYNPKRMNRNINVLRLFAFVFHQTVGNWHHYKKIHNLQFEIKKNKKKSPS